jgi:cellulose synthase/poly-beta-1,6-N-acetylglucosamine synthase-like glycosyltransferase
MAQPLHAPEVQVTELLRPTAGEAHRPALLDQLTRGKCKRTCRRLTSLLLAAGCVLPMLGGLGWYVVRPIVNAFGNRAAHDVKPAHLTPVDFKPYFPVNNTGEWVLLVALGLACFFNALVSGSTFLLFMRRRFQQCTMYTPRYPRNSGLREHLLDRPIAVVVPCYLPNEQAILLETVQHILTKLRHAGPLTLYIVHNTPTELPFEDELHALAARQEGVPPGRRLVVLKVEGSRSKAENLNFVFELIDDEVTAIYDADHHPDPNSLEMLLRKLQNHQVDCVQGSTYIRNTGWGLMSRVIDAEFFVTYFIYFISLQFIAGTGFFGGSNAVWRTLALKGEKFSTAMQTEDIELSTRALLKNKRIRFCPEARSGELAPCSLSALYKQRLRWAMGWEQVTLHHIGQVRRARISCGRKLGLIYMLPMRWLLALLSVTGAIVTPVLCYIYPPSIWPLALDFLFTLGLLQSSLLVTCTLLESIYHEAFVQCLFVAGFMMVSPLYLLLQVCMLIASLWRIVRGQTGTWVVTQRGAAPNAAPRTASSAANGSEAVGTVEPLVVADASPARLAQTVGNGAREASDADASSRIAPPQRQPIRGLERFYGNDVDSSPQMPALGSARHTL